MAYIDTLVFWIMVVICCAFARYHKWVECIFCGLTSIWFLAWFVVDRLVK